MYKERRSMSWERKLRCSGTGSCTNPACGWVCLASNKGKIHDVLPTGIGLGSNDMIGTAVAVYEVVEELPEEAPNSGLARRSPAYLTNLSHASTAYTL